MSVKSISPIKVQNNGSSADVFITGVIGLDVRGDEVISQLSMLNELGVTINLHIFSEGGLVFDALAVYDFIKGKGIKVNAIGSGLVGSAATIIALAADKVSIGSNSFWFIHNAFGGENQDSLDKINERIVSIYSGKTGLKKNKLVALMKEGDEGALLSAKEAKTLGFVDEVFTENAMAASYNGLAKLTEIKSLFNMEETNVEETVEETTEVAEINEVDDTVEPTEVETATEAEEAEVELEEVQLTFQERITGKFIREKSNYEALYATLHDEYKTIKAELEDTQSELSEAKAEVETLKEAEATNAETIVEQEKEVEEAKKAVEEKEAVIEELKKEPLATETTVTASEPQAVAADPVVERVQPKKEGYGANIARRMQEKNNN